MSQRVTKIRVKQSNGYSAPVPIGVDASNVLMDNGIGLNDKFTEVQNSIPVFKTVSRATYNGYNLAQKANGMFYLVS